MMVMRKKFWKLPVDLSQQTTMTTMMWMMMMLHSASSWTTTEEKRNIWRSSVQSSSDVQQRKKNAEPLPSRKRKLHVSDDGGRNKKKTDRTEARTVRGYYRITQNL